MGPVRERKRIYSPDRQKRKWTNRLKQVNYIHKSFPRPIGQTQAGIRIWRGADYHHWRQRSMIGASYTKLLQISRQGPTGKT